MEKRNVTDKRVVKLEDLLRADYIPFLGGRPERQNVISTDEVTNLSILLNTTETVDELIASL